MVPIHDLFQTSVSGKRRHVQIELVYNCFSLKSCVSLSITGFFLHTELEEVDLFEVHTRIVASGFLFHCTLVQ